MLYALREALPSAILEAIFMFVAVSLILGMNIPEMLTCILARISFTMLFIAGNVVISRIWKGTSAKAIIMLLYVVTMLILAAPGVVLAILVSVFGNFALPGMTTAFLALTICNILVSLLSLFLCRNMLQYAELNYQ